MLAFGDYNVVLITLDCCRYDVLSTANIPTIRSLGQIRRAVSYGSYTLPSHISIFCGYLPNVMDPPALPFYSRETMQLWRLVGARARDSRSVGLMLAGDDILEGYRRLDYHIVGAGGVRWFRNGTLTRGFDRFFYWGNEDFEDVFTLRRPGNFALAHANELMSELAGKRRWFLFVNSHETHVPYDTGETPLGRDNVNLLEYCRPVWGGKSLNVPDREISTEILRPLYDLQVAALEVVDARLRTLLDRLPTPYLVVICGDHGEAFGEPFRDIGRFGHGFPSPVVMEVPLVVGFRE